MTLDYILKSVSRSLTQDSFASDAIVRAFLNRHRTPDPEEDRLKNEVPRLEDIPDSKTTSCAENSAIVIDGQFISRRALYCRARRLAKSGKARKKLACVLAMEDRRNPELCLGALCVELGFVTDRELRQGKQAMLTVNDANTKKVCRYRKDLLRELRIIEH